jgi:hypothetical protein
MLPNTRVVFYSLEDSRDVTVTENKNRKAQSKCTFRYIIDRGVFICVANKNVFYHPGGTFHSRLNSLANDLGQTTKEISDETELKFNSSQHV